MSKKLDSIETYSLKEPSILKTLNFDELEQVCLNLRNELLNEVSKHGGHLSSNLGIVETTVTLHRVFDFSKDKIIFDVGHQSYIHKMITGRSLETLGQKNGISGFQKRNESKYDCYEAGHSSTSISAAEGFAIARDLKKDKYDVVAVIGDGSVVNGLSFEALNDIGNNNHKVIIVLNDNDMAISQPTGGLSNYFRKISSSVLYNKSKIKYRNSLQGSKFGSKVYKLSSKLKDSVRRLLVHSNSIFEELGFTYIGPVDGHNLKALEKAFEKAKQTTKSTVVHVRTIKGKGYSLAENDTVGYWHGVTPFDLTTGKATNTKDGLISWSSLFASLTNEIMDDRKESFLIVPATANGSELDDCLNNHKERSLDVGIAEEHALTLAGSISLNGFHPIVSIYSTFLQRAYDEISHDCARMNTNLTLLIDRAGLVGSNGETHQGIYDVAFLSSIPNVTVTMPTNQNEAKQLYLDSFNDHSVFAIRYPRTFFKPETKYEPLNIPFGSFSFKRISKRKNKLVIAVGPNGIDLLNKINESNIDVSFASALYLNNFNDETIKKICEYKTIIIYDSYGTQEGFAANLEQSLIANSFDGKIVVKAIPNCFVQQASIKEQLEDLSLDIDSIFKLISNLK